MTKIYNRDGDVLYESEKETLRQAVIECVGKYHSLEGANLKGANLRGAYLEGAYLRGANLEGVNLRGAYLESANLRRANLNGANLRGAYLEGAYLEGANLRDANFNGAYLSGAKINWNSHQLVSEILARAAERDIEKLKLAGLVRLKTDWCWKQFLALDGPNKEWALTELKKWVKDGDGHPAVLSDTTEII